MTALMLRRLLALGAALGPALAWPVPYNTSAGRPAPNPSCGRPSPPFCARGLPGGRLPDFFPDDRLLLFALSRTETQFKDTPIQSSMTTYGLGLHSVRTGANYSVAWLPMYGLYQATVPHVMADDYMYFCDQGAVCLGADISTSEWSSVRAIGYVGADHFDSFSVWVKYYNNTMPFHQSFAVQEKTDGGQSWMLPVDNSAFLINAVKMLRSIGAQFQPISLDLTFFVVTCEAPTLLGSPETLRSKDFKTYSDIADFYDTLQSTGGWLERHLKELRFIWKVHFEKKFYYYFNQLFWKLKVHSPYWEVKTMPLKLA